MARLVLILGDSGTGKSTSLRNFKKEEVGVISVTGKELPFKTDIKVSKVSTYEQIVFIVKESKASIVVIDDIHYMMSNFEFATINENGYGKFARNAQGMVSVFEAILNKESDQTFYLMAHTAHTDDGKLQFRSTGKMVEEKYNPLGVTNIVLEASYDEQSDRFVFKTKADGTGIKSPMGMFDEPVVDNDLKEVHKKITEFYS